MAISMKVNGAGTSGKAWVLKLGLMANSIEASGIRTNEMVKEYIYMLMAINI